MVKKKELSEDLRQRLVRAHSEGKGYKAISKQYDVPVATVQSIINKHKRFHTVKNLSGRGRKRKVSPKLARKICREVNNNPQTTTKALIETLGQAGIKVSRSTIESCTEEVSMDAGLGRHHCSGRNMWRLVWPLLKVI